MISSYLPTVRTVATAVLIASIAQQAALGQSPNRPSSSEGWARLSSKTQFDGPDNTNDDDDWVISAAGAIEFQVPTGWRVWQQPKGREVRLVVTPPNVASGNSTAADGFWICYHARTADPNDIGMLASFVESRLPEGIRPTADPRSRPVTISGWNGVETQFESSSTEFRGSHCAIVTDWGIVEVEMSASNDRQELCRAGFERFIRTLKLGAPRDQRLATNSNVVDSAPILGVWKGFNSRLKLFGDGRVVMTKDSLPDRAIDAGPAHQPALEGTFVAEQDLLYVTWSDGSKLNFRWRKKDSDLLLTDHEGRTSLMRKIYE